MVDLFVEADGELLVERTSIEKYLKGDERCGHMSYVSIVDESERHRWEVATFLFRVYNLSLI